MSPPSVMTSVSRSNNRSVILLLILFFSVDLSASPLTDLLQRFLDIEIGKTGSCESYTQLDLVNRLRPVQYAGYQRLLSSVEIGVANPPDVQSTQHLLLDPYQGYPLLPNAQGLPAFSVPIQSSRIFRITYRSSTSLGNETTLSGLVVVPEGVMSNGMVVYNHATQVDSITGAPSHPSHEACTVLTALAGKGRVLAMPDYLGYGVNHEPHPYPLGIQNAQSGIDIIIAAHELAGIINPFNPLGAQLVISGYSEGGGNALWLARTIASENPDLLGSQLSLIAPMSGNYDMTGAMARSLIVDQPPMGLYPTNFYLTWLSKPLLAIFAAQGATEFSTATLQSLMAVPFLEVAQDYHLPLVSLELPRFAEKLILKAADVGYTPVIRNPSVLMTPEFLEAIQTTDLSSPVISLWESNNNLTWVPQNAAGSPIPMYVTGILQDEIVPFAGNQYPLPTGYVRSPYFAAGNSQNLLATLRGAPYFVSADQVAWCGINAVQVPNRAGTGLELINHLNGLPPVLAVAATAIENGHIANVPTIPDPPPTSH
jgi:hypothetical protein